MTGMSWTHVHPRKEIVQNAKSTKGLTQDEIDDLDYEFKEETAFIENLENRSGKYDWMKEKSTKQCFETSNQSCKA